MKAILTYHSIDDSGSVISIRPVDFRRHLAWLVARGPPVTTVEGLLALPADADAVALTFDDGFANFESTAWPLLREHRLPVTVFLPSELVGSSNTWDTARRGSIPVLPLLGWDSVARLAEQGVTLGAHSRTHPDLRSLSGAALRDELEGAQQRIERESGQKPKGLAYPFGYHNAQVRQAAREVYSWACGVELRPLAARDDPFRLPRVDAHYLRAAGRLEGWGSPALTRYLRLRSGARRLRRVLPRGRT